MNSDTPRLRTPRFRVVVELDGAPVAVDVQSTQADAVRFDLMRGRNRWPSVQDAPILWTTVVAWAALRREGHELPAKFDDALDVILSVETLTADGEPAEVDPERVGVDPTHGGA